MFLRPILFFVFMLSCIACSDNPKNATTTSEPKARFAPIYKANTPIVLNGSPDETAWQRAEWYSLDNVWIGENLTSDDFNGRFKLLWSTEKLYILAETNDDILMDIHEDGLDRYWDDDCLELFIDENNSDGIHQYNSNAFAYHIATNLRVTDIDNAGEPIYYDHHLQTAKVTSGTKSTWEIAMNVYTEDYVMTSSPRVLSAGEELGFMVAYCDNDNSKEREHFIGSIPIEGEDKNRGWIDAGVFNNWTLVE